MITENRIITFAILLLSISLYSQETQNPEVKSPEEFFSGEKAKVLVVGSIHFDYPNLDAAKTKEEDQMDVLEESKQQEVVELANYIKQFRPNKIGIEAWDSFKATEKLREYKKGNLRNIRSERYQLGMRIADDLDLDTLYAVDAEPMVADLAKLDSTYVEELFRGYDFESEDSIVTTIKKWYQEINRLPAQMNLLDYYKYINSEEHHKYEFGAYLVGDFKLGDTRGADVLSIWWYNRNLRIFRNIQQITEGPEDRILVIIGNGHAAILRQLFGSSPEYEFIEFSNL